MYVLLFILEIVAFSWIVDFDINDWLGFAMGFCDFVKGQISRFLS